MRVITGKYRNKRFDIPKTFSARPTTDFAKENLFNILSNVYVDFEECPTALDLFSGTGSIGLELLSRGCSRVVSVEKNYKHYQFIKKISEELKDDAWQLILGDALKYIEKSPESFDIVFADPPYTLPNIGEIPQLVLSSSLLNENGIFIMEHGKTNDFSSIPSMIDHRVYGSVNFSIFRKED